MTVGGVAARVYEGGTVVVVSVSVQCDTPEPEVPNTKFGPMRNIQKQSFSVITKLSEDLVLPTLQLHLHQSVSTPRQTPPSHPSNPPHIIRRNGFAAARSQPWSGHALSRWPDPKCSTHKENLCNSKILRQQDREHHSVQLLHSRLEMDQSKP